LREVKKQGVDGRVKRGHDEVRRLGLDCPDAHAPESKKFFGSFFQKRTACLLT
jgi:hypothetical protein